MRLAQSWVSECRRGRRKVSEKRDTGCERPGAPLAKCMTRNAGNRHWNSLSLTGEARGWERLLIWGKLQLLNLTTVYGMRGGAQRFKTSSATKKLFDPEQVPSPSQASTVSSARWDDTRTFLRSTQCAESVTHTPGSWRARKASRTGARCCCCCCLSLGLLIQARGVTACNRRRMQGTKVFFLTFIY